MQKLPRELSTLVLDFHDVFSEEREAVIQEFKMIFCPAVFEEIFKNYKQ